MRSLTSLSYLRLDDLFAIFRLADDMQKGSYSSLLQDKTVVMFFPQSSLRTRMTFEKGIRLLGGHPVLFPPETLDKKEALVDVCGYLENWADMVIVRHPSIDLMRQMASHLHIPVINAMSSVNHPCEILSDLYALSKRRSDFQNDRYLFVGARGNIGMAWKEAADLLGLDLEQCCPPGYEIDGLSVHHDILSAVRGKDVVCTDSLPASAADAFAPCRVTLEAMGAANPGAVLNPCPPFYRGEEVDAGVIDSPYFAGYAFKRALLEVQQAVMAYCLMTNP